MKHRGSRLYCFSPPVMVATFVIELALLVLTLWRYKLTQATRLIVVLLVGLAFFQLAEFQVCTGDSLRVPGWSRAGFLAITVLPILSLHLIHVITGKLQRVAVAGYVSMLPWCVIFLMRDAFQGFVCGGNYVIFQLVLRYNIPYLAYYYVWLLAGLGACLYYCAKSKNKLQRRALGGLAIGYLSFMLPTLVIHTLEPNTFLAIPSIMCGFAVVYAVILVGVVAPAVSPVRRKKK